MAESKGDGHPFIVFDGVDLACPSARPLVWANLLPPQASAIRSSDHKTEAEYTIGDLHGNVVLGLWHALNAGIAKFPEGSQAYRQLVELYDAEDEDEYNPADAPDLVKSRKARHAEFQQILQTLQATEIGPFIKFRSLGDTISDRGAYDPCTLWLFDHLEALTLNLVVLASNHDMYMLCAYERAKRKVQQEGGSFTQAMVQCYTEERRKRSSSREYYASGYQFVTALEMGLITEAEFQALLERHKKRLRLIDYHYVPASPPQPANLCIYMHGVVGVEAIRSCAKYFDIEYQAGTPEELIQTITAINSAFGKMDDRSLDLISNYDATFWFAIGNERRLRGQKPDFALTKQERQQVWEVGAFRNPLTYLCEARGYGSLDLPEAKNSPQKDPEILTFGEIALSKPVDGDASDAKIAAPSAPKTPAPALLYPGCNLGIMERPTLENCEVIFVHGHHQRIEHKEGVVGASRYFATIPDQPFYSLDQSYGDGQFEREQDPLGFVFVQLDFVSTQKHRLQEKRRPIFAVAQSFRNKKRWCYAGGFLFFLPVVIFPARAVLPYCLSLPNWILCIPNLATMNVVMVSLVASFLFACYLCYRGRDFGVQQAKQDQVVASIDAEISQLAF